jgi:hypothetical protein
MARTTPRLGAVSWGGFASIAAGAALGAASFGWVERLGTLAPAVALGMVAVILVPLAVPALLDRRPLTARSWLFPSFGTALAYAAAVLLCYAGAVSGGTK